MVKTVSLPENYLNLVSKDKGITAVYLSYFIKFKYCFQHIVVGRQYSILAEKSGVDVKTCRKYIEKFISRGWCHVDRNGHLHFKNTGEICKIEGMDRHTKFGCLKNHPLQINIKDSAYQIRTSLFKIKIIKSIRSQLAVKRSIVDLSDSKNLAHNPRYLPKNEKQKRYEALRVLKGINTHGITSSHAKMKVSAVLSVSYFAKAMGVSLSSGMRFKKELISSSVITSTQNRILYAKDISLDRYKDILKHTEWMSKGYSYDVNKKTITKILPCSVSLC